MKITPSYGKDDICNHQSLPLCCKYASVDILNLDRKISHYCRDLR